MHRVFNFSAGPATLPEVILQQIKEELFDWRGQGMSVMEISHRSKAFVELMNELNQDLRSLLNIPENYHILYLPGGARTQFSMIPQNLLGDKKTADYINTGVWSTLAMDYAKPSCTVNCVADAKDLNYLSIPDPKTWRLDPDVAYFHYTANETIYGLEFPGIPDVGDVPLVSDMTSNILARPIDISRFGMIYASAQKNMGIAGILIAIIREDLLDRVPENKLPPVLDYRVQAKANSMVNTIPTFPCYVTALLAKWCLAQGGLETIAKQNTEKAAILYQAIDDSDGFYQNQIEAQYRSVMNVPFRLSHTDLEPVFLKEAEKSGFCGLKGHRFLGGCRASIYNAMPKEGILALTDFMNDFRNRY